MKCPFIFVLSISLFLHSSYSSASVYFSYGSLSDANGEPGQIAIDKKKRTMWVGHAGREISICEDSSPFFCFTGGPFSFFVPKSQEIKIGQNWSGDDFSYDVVGAVVIESLGFREECFVILSRQGGDVVRFFYSQKSGLIAMSFQNASDNDFADFYLIKGASGFPFN